MASNRFSRRFSQKIDILQMSCSTEYEAVCMIKIKKNKKKTNSEEVQF